MEIFAGIRSLKFEKVGPAFPSFNTCQSLPFVARQQDKLINIDSHNKSGPFFWNSIDAKICFSF